MNITSVQSAIREVKNRPFTAREVGNIKAVQRILHQQDFAGLSDRELSGVAHNLRASLDNLNAMIYDKRN
jgi:hypothetical protein